MRNRIEKSGERLWRFKGFPGVPVSASRMARQGKLQRPSEGVYYRARQTALGSSLPNPTMIQRLAAARKTVLPAGIAAANLLGFTMQAEGREVATSALSLPRKARWRRNGDSHAAARGLGRAFRDGGGAAELPAARRQDERSVPRRDGPSDLGTVPGAEVLIEPVLSEIGKIFKLFLRLSQGLDTAVIRMPAPTHSKPLLLEEFCQWMREHRGSSERTLYNYGLPIRELIRRFGEDLDKLDAQSLRTFVLSQSRNVGWAKAKRCTTALRMFLRFLITENRSVDKRNKRHFQLESGQLRF